MFKTLTSFFRFHYYNITRNKTKRDELVTHPDYSWATFITPLVFVLIHAIASFFLPLTFAVWMFAWLPVFVANTGMLITMRDNVNEEKREAERVERRRKQKEQEAKAERLYQEELRRQQEERDKRRRQHMEFEEILRRERERKMYEEAYKRWVEEERIKKQRQEEAERRAYEEFRKSFHYNHQWNQQQRSQYSYEYDRPSQKPRVDQNIINAMKLMGLKEGYTESDVKKAYRKMSKIHHPDVGGLPENFKKLKTAYDYIMARI